MFFNELNPLFQELTQQPIAFVGGLCSGIFRLNLADDPVKSWLDKQSGSTTASNHSTGSSNTNGNAPQTISID